MKSITYQNDDGTKMEIAIFTQLAAPKTSGVDIDFTPSYTGCNTFSFVDSDELLEFIEDLKKLHGQMVIFNQNNNVKQ